jgi:hypothetical protein
MMNANAMSRIYKKIDDEETIKVFTRALGLMKCDGWTVSQGINSIVAEKLKLPESNVLYYKVTAESIDRPLNELVSKIWDSTEKSAKKYEPTTVEWKVLEVGENWKTRAQVNNLGVKGVYPRQIVFKQTKIDVSRKESMETGIAEGVYLIAHSVEHPDAPLDPNNYVRANVKMSVYHFSSLENGETKVVRIVNVDPCGWLPKWLVNMFATNMCNMFDMWSQE